MSDHERKSDSVLEELKRFVEEESRISREWRDKHDIDALKFRTEIMEEIKPFKEFAVSVSWGWKILLGISALILSVAKAFVWIKAHVK